MCEVCRKVKNLSPGDAWQIIGDALVNAAHLPQKQREHLLDLAESFDLKEEEDEEDVAMALEWERYHRGG